MLLIVIVLTLMLGIAIGFQIERHPQQVEHTELEYDPLTDEFIPIDEPKETKERRRAKYEADSLDDVINYEETYDFDEMGRRING